MPYNARTQDTTPEGYYTSKYSGEEIDALLDKVAALEAAVNTLASAAGISLAQSGGT